MMMSLTHTQNLERVREEYGLRTRGVQVDVRELGNLALVNGTEYYPFFAGIPRVLPAYCGLMMMMKT